MITTTSKPATVSIRPTIMLLGLALPLALVLGIVLASPGTSAAKETGAHAQSVPFLDEPLDWLAPVAEIEIFVYQSPLQVLVYATGRHSDSCAYLEGYTQSRDGFTFNVILTESSEGGTCWPHPLPFYAWIDLDIAGLQAGTYTVDVNGVTGTFTLPEPLTPTPTLTGTPPTATPTNTPTNTPTLTPTYTPTPVPDFTLSVSPTSRSVSRPGTTTYTVNLVANSSYSGSVSLSVSGLPDRINYSFSPNPVALTPGGSRSSVLTITTRSSTPAGTYTLTIRGTDGVRTRSQTVTLIVNR